MSDDPSPGARSVRSSSGRFSVPVPVLLAEAIGERYSLERELARGGMATVYLAQDHQKPQAVAIKVMHPKLATVLGAERFLREIRVAKAMDHPLIVPLVDSGNARGLLYYVMPYIDGESLFERLQRERRLPVDDSLKIARDVADALGYAHAHGVLHRDVKPENILLAGGRALVADFGLARAIGAADSRKLTATGIIVGTTFYMSPEQLREDKDIDQRSDIYALGCLLFEMLTGGPPYVGTSLKDVVTKILLSPIPSVRRLNPNVPVQVEQALTKALAKAVGDRFRTMDEFAAALPSSS